MTFVSSDLGQSEEDDDDEEDELLVAVGAKDESLPVLAHAGNLASRGVVPGGTSVSGNFTRLRKIALVLPLTWLVPTDSRQFVS